MEQKCKQAQELTLVSVAELSSPSYRPSSVPESSPLFARFSSGASGAVELRFHRESESIDGFRVDLGDAQVSVICCGSGDVCLTVCEFRGNEEREMKKL